MWQKLNDVHTYIPIYIPMHGYKNARHEDAPTHSHMHIILMWQSRIEMQIISEVKVKKTFKCMMFAVIGRQGVCCPRGCGLGTRCVEGEN